MDVAYPNFHGVEVTPPPRERALFHVIPVPYERTTSYGKGTRMGPLAILEASRALELFDGRGVPADAGIFTYAAMNCEGMIEDVMDRIADQVREALHWDGIPVVLGGEHTVTYGALKAFAEKGEAFGLVQFDAHADLRHTYQGSVYSHGCVMRRIRDLEVPVFQIGIRSLSFGEHELRQKGEVGFLDAETIARDGLPEVILPKDFPEKIYITFDVDAWDPSLMPSTGTPEPGGLTWYQAIEALENVMRGRTVIGFDVVELSPIENLHAPDFTCAKLIYMLMGMIMRDAKA